MYRPSIRLSLAIAGWLGILIAHSVTAQDKAPDAAKTTLGGIYTEDQAARGQKIYGMSCLGGCHNSSSHKGVAFKQNWGGHPLKELFERIKDTMPDDNPGLLTAKEAIDVVSYMLKANGMPAGKDELASDKDELAKIKIELPPSGGSPNR
jgi:hypothetical protein